MLANTLFVKVVTQSQQRGYILLAGFESSVTHRTCVQYITLGGATRESLNDAIARLKVTHSAGTITDVTDNGIKRKLNKLFGEELPLTEKQQALRDANPQPEA